jgi:D-glycero-D-manno-heptose 1,7-bisphosphate phosphatase
MDERSLLVLDIDGTVRHGFDELGKFVNSPADVVIFPEAIDRMHEWKDAGGRIIGVSNQAGVGLGYMTEEDCQASMDRTNELTGYLFDEIVWCLHKPSDGCVCRKPRIGLLIKAGGILLKKHNEIYHNSAMRMVGDRREDQEFAERAMIRFQWADEWRRGVQP